MDKHTKPIDKFVIHNTERILGRTTTGAIYSLDLCDGIGAWHEALRINPGLSLEHKRKVLPYKNPEDLEHYMEGLRKANVDAPS